jgi:hypothetical protein
MCSVPMKLVAELQGLADRQIDNLFGPGRERRRTGRPGPDGADGRGLLDLFPHPLQADAERLQRFGGDALPLEDEPEEEMLRADKIAVAQLRFLLGHHHHRSGSIRETLEHANSSRR